MDTSSYFRFLLFLQASLLGTLICSADGRHHTYAGGRQMCHCAGDVACDVTSGRCPGGTCAASWWGYTCQSGMTYQGCYQDDATRPQRRDVFHRLPDEPTNTPQVCAQKCIELNYTVSAVQFGSQCFCDNNYGQYGSSNGCSMSCPGDSNQICGGSSANSVYQLDYPAPVQVPGPVGLQKVEPGPGPRELELLTWRRPHNTSDLAVKHYHVMYRFTKYKSCSCQVNAGWKTVVLSGDQYNVVLLNLTIPVHYAYSEFEVKMAAELDSIEKGTIGPYSPSITGESSSAVPTGGVANIVAASRMTTSLTWTWDPPPCGSLNGPLVHYNVTLFQGSSVKNATNIWNSTSTGTRIKFNNLSPGTEYCITVEFVNDVGPAPTTTSNGTFTDEYVSPSPGLSSTYVAVISVAAVLLVCGTVALLVYLYKRRGRKQGGQGRATVGNPVRVRPAAAVGHC